jgi:hypothetical protein
MKEQNVGDLLIPLEVLQSDPTKDLIRSFIFHGIL